MYLKSIDQNLQSKNENEDFKICDWNYKESASNFANCTRVELIDEDKYYQLMKMYLVIQLRVDKNMFNDYGQHIDQTII